MEFQDQQQAFRNYVLKKQSQNQTPKTTIKSPPHPDLILTQAVKNSYQQPIIKEIIQVDRFNDFLIKGDELCYKMCFYDVYDSQTLRNDIIEFNRDPKVCHSNCLDKLKFSKEIMLNNLKNNPQFQDKVLRYQRHSDIKKLNEYENYLKKISGIDESMLERIKSLV